MGHGTTGSFSKSVSRMSSMTPKMRKLPAVPDGLSSEPVPKFQSAQLPEECFAKTTPTLWKDDRT